MNDLTPAQVERLIRKAEQRKAAARTPRLRQQANLASQVLRRQLAACTHNQ